MLDNCKGAPMGKGHGNKCAEFDIETACYLIPQVAAYHLPTTRKLVIMAGVKTLKSFFVELAAAYHICHSIGDVIIYFGTGEVADDVSTTRILSYYDGIASYRDKLSTLAKRFDETNSAVKFPDKTFFLKPANLGNLQQKNLGFMGFQDAFVTGATGMIDQGIERTTQYASDKKIVIESQGGEAGFDFDRHYLDTDQRELHVACPDCGKSHLFNWKVFDDSFIRRGDDFVPTPPLIVPSLDHGAWIEHNRPLLLDQTKRIAGFKCIASDKINCENVHEFEKDVLYQTRFECFHCGSLWRDDGQFGDTRIGLDKSSHYIPARHDALIENVGFNTPQWINRRLPWGNILLQKFKREQVAAAGNIEPLKQWWQKFAARTWSEELLDGTLMTSFELNYDPANLWDKEWRRCGIVDVQLHGTHFWVEFFAIAKDGEARSLWCGCMMSFKEIEEKQLELKVQHNRMFFDAQHEGDLVKKECLRRGRWIQPQGKRGFWLGWNMLSASGRDKFKRVQKNKRGEVVATYFDNVSDGEMYFETIEGQRREVFRFNFSALAAGDMFVRYRDGKDRNGRPNQKIHFLNEPIGSDKIPLSHVSQINSRFRDNKAIDKFTGRPKPMWKVKASSRADHYFAIGQMLMAAYRLWNVAGQMEETKDEAA